jgi:hypothetical protein
VEKLGVNEPELESVTAADTATARSPSLDSDTQSQKSCQATVEDDFEDLGAETLLLISASSRPSSPSEIKEPKGKKKVLEESAVVAKAQPEAPAQQQHEP